MKMIRLAETIDIDTLLVSGAVFSHIESDDTNPFEWLNSNLALKLDEMLYLERSGDKIISPYMRRLIKLQEDGKILDYLSSVAKYLIVKFNDKWNKVYNAFIESDYNPIENYSMVQEETPNITKETNSKTNTDLKTKTTEGSEIDTYGFNSSNSVPTGESETNTDVEVTGSKDTNFTDVKETETGSRKLTRSGNIGVTTSQQMLQSEIELRKFNFIDMILKDVDSVMCLHIYR